MQVNVWNMNNYQLKNSYKVTVYVVPAIHSVLTTSLDHAISMKVLLERETCLLSFQLDGLSSHRRTV